MREAFRKNKTGIYEFLEANDLHYSILFIYTQKEIAPYKSVEEKIILAIRRFEEELKKKIEKK